MKNIIQLHSRYVSDNYYLEKIGDPSSKKYLLHAGEWTRFGKTDDPKVYSFVDPSGGPFIQKGTIIEGMTVDSITQGDKGTIIEFG